MIGRVVLLLTFVALVVGLLLNFWLPHPVAAQDPWPTPVGQLGGPMPLPTEPGLLGGSLPQDTPTPVPAHHPLVGTWLFTLPEGDQSPTQLAFGNDGFVLFTDAGGNRGAGVWVAQGEQTGTMAVAVRETDASDQPRAITMLQGTIDVQTAGNVATLRYTIETVEASGATAERAGPFQAVGRRVGEEPA